MSETPHESDSHEDALRRLEERGWVLFKRLVAPGEEPVHAAEKTVGGGTVQLTNTSPDGLAAAVDSYEASSASGPAATFVSSKPLRDVTPPQARVETLPAPEAKLTASEEEGTTRSAPEDVKSDVPVTAVVNPGGNDGSDNAPGEPELLNPEETPAPAEETATPVEETPEETPPSGETTAAS